MKLLEDVPWWLLSAGLHAVLLLGAALVYIEKLYAVDNVIVCFPHWTEPARDAAVETPRGLIDRENPIPKDGDPRLAEEAIVFDPAIPPNALLDEDFVPGIDPKYRCPSAQDLYGPLCKDRSRTRVVSSRAPLPGQAAVAYRQRFDRNRGAMPKTTLTRLAVG
jgi:hypothetical protein